MTRGAHGVQYHAVMLSCCHTVILSCCHAAMQSYCHVVMLFSLSISSAFVIINNPCHVMMRSCFEVVILSCCHGVMLSCHVVFLWMLKLSCCHFVIFTYIVVIFCCVVIFMLRCCAGYKMSCCHVGIVVLWCCHNTFTLSCHAHQLSCFHDVIMMGIFMLVYSDVMFSMLLFSQYFHSCVMVPHEALSYYAECPSRWHYLLSVSSDCSSHWCVVPCVYLLSCVCAGAGSWLYRRPVMGVDNEW